MRSLTEILIAEKLPVTEDRNGSNGDSGDHWPIGAVVGGSIATA